MGNALNVVLAPAKRISMVAAWTRIKKAEPNAPLPKIVDATWEITVGVSLS